MIRVRCSIARLPHADPALGVEIVRRLRGPQLRAVTPQAQLDLTNRRPKKAHIEESSKAPVSTTCSWMIDAWPNHRKTLQATRR